MSKSAKQLDPNEWLTLVGAAMEIAMSESGLRKLVARTKARRLAGRADPDGIEFFQLGRGWIKFRRAWLIDFVERHKLEPLTENLEPLAKKPKKVKPLSRPDSHGIRY